MSAYSTAYQDNAPPSSSYEKLPLLELRRDRRRRVSELIQAAIRALTPPENRRALRSTARHLGHDYHSLMEAGLVLQQDTQRSGVQKWVMALPTPPPQDSLQHRVVMPGNRSLDRALRSAAAVPSLQDVVALRFGRSYPARTSSMLHSTGMFTQDEPSALIASPVWDGAEDANHEPVASFLENGISNNALLASNNFPINNPGSSSNPFSHSSTKHSAAMLGGVSSSSDLFADPASSGPSSSNTGYSSPAPSVDLDSLSSTEKDNCKRHGRIFTAQDISDLNLMLGIAARDVVEADWVCELHAFHGGFEGGCKCGRQGGGE